MAIISLQEALEKAYDDDFWKLRGIAIQAYASLEQSLCSLMALAAQLDRGSAAVIFFKITNADARNSILEELIHRRFAGEFDAFWKSARKLIAAADKKRNAIVHWNAINWVYADEAGQTVVRLSLKPGQADPTAGGEEIVHNDLVDFTDRCDFVARILNAFAQVASGSRRDADAEAWLKAFREEKLAYPPRTGSKFDLSKGGPGNQTFIVGNEA